MGDFVYPILICVVASAGTFAIAALWCRAKSTTASTHLCARCFRALGSVAGPSSCFGCGANFSTSGVIPPGAKVRRRMSVAVLSFGLFWLFAAGWYAMNMVARGANLLQREESTFQGQLVCSVPSLEIGAGWWRTREPFRPESSVVTMQGMQFGGKLSQHHGPDGPSRWSLEGRSEASGDGEVTAEAIRQFLSHAEFDPNDPQMASRIADLRLILLGGPSLAPPTESDWRLRRPFGPYTDVESSRLIIVSTALLSLAGWVMVSGWCMVRARRHGSPASLAAEPA